MSTLRYWNNQTLKMQSAIGAVQTIDAISQASPGVITKNSGATLPSNGDYVLLSVAGTRQVNNRVFKVAGASGSTFNIGVDTSAFDDFTSGTYQVITFGHTFDSIRDPNFTGGDPVFEDITSVENSEDVQDIISASPQGFSCTHNWDPDFAPLIAANLAFTLRSPRAFLLSDADGAEFLFYGTLSATLAPTTSGKKKVTPLSVSLKAPGVGY